MEEPPTKPSGSKPASPSSTYSDTDRSEVNTAPCSAPAAWARRPSAACGSQVAPAASCPLPNTGIFAPRISARTASAALGGGFPGGLGAGLGLGRRLQFLLVRAHPRQRILIGDVSHRTVAADLAGRPGRLPAAH